MANNVVIEALNGVDGIATSICNERRGEKRLFAAAVTFLRTSSGERAGWTPKRLFQRRGVLVITDKHLEYRSGFVSGFTAMGLGLAVYFAWQYWGAKEVMDLLLAVGGCVLVLQRLPYRLSIPLEQIESVRKMTVRGLVSRGEGVIVGHGGRFVQFVGHQPLTPAASRALSASRDTPNATC